MGAIPDILQSKNGQKYEMGVYNREPFWHRVGDVWVPEPGQEQDILSLKEAIHRANLNDLDYRTQEVYTLVNDEFVEVPGRRAVTRVNPADRGERQLISDVGNQTHMFQIEAFGEFAETVLEMGAPDGVEVEALFQMYDGGMTVYVFRLPELIEIGGEHLVRYLMVIDYYDGRGAAVMKTVYIRPGCANTVAAGMAERTTMVKVPHGASGIEGKVAWAREGLGIRLKSDPVMTAAVQELIDTQVTDDKFTEIIKDQFPDAPVDATDRQKNTVLRKRKQVWDVYEGPTLTEFQGTAWGALNAFTEAMQWAPGTQTSDKTLVKRQASPQVYTFENSVLKSINKVLSV